MPNSTRNPQYLNTQPSVGRESLNERVQVYVRVRPIFKNELIEDLQNAETVKKLHSPLKDKVSSVKDSMHMGSGLKNEDQENDSKTGCVVFAQNQP